MGLKSTNSLGKKFPSLEDLEYSTSSYFKKISKMKLFYFNIIPCLATRWNRTKAISILIICFSTLQEAALIINLSQDSSISSSLSQEKITDTFIQFFQYFLLTHANIILRIPFFILFVLNMSLIFSITVLFIVFWHKPYDSRKIDTFLLRLSQILKIYNYTLYLPSLATSVKVISQYEQSTIQIIGLFNYISTILIGLVLNSHDYEYSFSSQDWMSRRKSIWETSRYLILAGLIMMNNFAGDQLLLVVISIYLVLKAVLYEFELQFINESTSLLQSSVNFLAVCFGIVMIAHDIRQSASVFVFLLILLPICYRFATIIHTTRKEALMQDAIGKTDLNYLSQQQLDLYIRHLVSEMAFFFEDYITKGQAIVFENIYINHLLTCQESGYRCFCYRFRRNEGDFNLSEYIGEEYRRSYVVFYIVDILEKYISDLQRSRKNAGQVQLMYLSFLCEVMKISTKSFSELYQFQNSLIQSKKGQSLQHYQNLQFTQILISRNNKTFQHYFNNPDIQNQRIHMMAMVIFDELIVSFRSQMRNYFIQMAQFFDFLCSNFIDLKDLEVRSKKLFAENTEIKAKMRKLFDLNPNDRELHFFSEIFNQLFDFENTKLSDLTRKSKRLAEDKLLLNEKNIAVFNEAHSCVVYASLNTIDGKITKVSQSFQNIYHINNNNILGNTINSLIPKGLYGAHDDFLKNFRNQGTMNVIMKGKRLVFGLSGRGFIIPLYIRLKLENMFGEFGVCSHLIRANTDKDYIFFSNEGNILDISENLFEKVFAANCPLSQIRRLNINNIIPLSYGVQKLEEFDQIFYSILVVKKGEASSNKNSRAVKKIGKMSSQSKSNSRINDYQSSCPDQIEDIVAGIQMKDLIYNITFQISLIPTSLGKTFKFVEIDSFSLESSKRKKTDSISQLSDCIRMLATSSNEQATPVLSQVNNSRYFAAQTAMKQYKAQKTISMSSDLEEDRTDTRILNSQKQLTLAEASDNAQMDGEQLTLTKERAKLLIQETETRQQQSSRMYVSPTTVRNRLEDEGPLSPSTQSNFLISPRYTETQSLVLQQAQSQVSGQQKPNVPSPAVKSTLEPQSNCSLLHFMQSLNTHFQIDLIQNQLKSYRKMVNDNLAIEQQVKSKQLTKTQFDQQQKKIKEYNSHMQNLYDESTKQVLLDSTDKRIIQSRTTKDELSPAYSGNNGQNDHIRSSTNDENKVKHDSEGELDNEIRSLQSNGISVLEQKKRIIIKKLKSKQISKGLKFFVATGLLSILGLSLLCTIQYLNMTSTFSLLYSNFTALNIFNSSMISLVRFIANYYYYVNNLQLLYQTPPAIAAVETVVAVSEFSSFRDVYQKQFEIVSTNIEGQEYQQVMYDMTTTYQTVYRNQTSDIINSTLLKNIPVIYSFAIHLASLNFLNRSTTNNIELRAILINYIQYSNDTFKLQDVCENQVTIQFDEVINLQYLNFGLILIVSVFLVITLLLISIIIKRQKERIFQLFGSFQPDKIQRYIATIFHSISFFDDNYLDSKQNSLKNTAKSGKINQVFHNEMEKANQKQIQKDIENHIKKFKEANNQSQLIQARQQGQRRNRSIASFSKFPKVNKILLMSSLLIILFLNAFPLASLILTSNFKDESSLIIQERIILLSSLNKLFDEQANLEAEFYFSKNPANNPTYRLDRIQFFSSNLARLMVEADEVIGKLSSLLNLMKQHTYDKDNFQNFVGSILSGDACQVMSKYPNYFEISSTKECLTAGNGILQKGLIITMNSIQSTFVSLQSTLEPTIASATKFLQYIISLETSSNYIVDLHHQLRQVGFVANGLDSYLVQHQKQSYDSFLKQFKIIFIVLILVICLIFSVGWYLLFKKLRSDLMRSKELLTLFHINLILENNLFLKFLKENSFGIDNNSLH